MEKTTMTTQATYDDVNLIVKLYELRREEKLRAARQWFVASFNARTMDELNKLCPPGSETNAYYRMVTTYWDMVSSFVVAGVLNEGLFFQSNREALLVWERVRDLLPQMREVNKDPSYLRNLETVAQSYVQYLNSIGPDVYTAWSSRIRAMVK